MVQCLKIQLVIQVLVKHPLVLLVHMFMLLLPQIHLLHPHLLLLRRILLLAQQHNVITLHLLLLLNAGFIGECLDNMFRATQHSSTQSLGYQMVTLTQLDCFSMRVLLLAVLVIISFIQTGLFRTIMNQ
jgi:hypothetical protein